MKIRLLVLLGITAVPLLSMGQTSPVFYNKGKMSIIGSDPEKVIMYVGGTFIADRDDVVKSEIKVDNSNTVITGHFLQNGKLVAASPENVFTEHTGKIGRITFRGVDNEQKISTRFNSGTDAVSGTNQPFNTEWKGVNYINFPTIVIDNAKHVTIAPEIAAKTQGVLLKKGKLILDSRIVNATDILKDPTAIEDEKHSPKNSSILAHLWYPADGVTYSYPTGKITKDNINDVGTIQVRIAVNPITGEDNTTDHRPLMGMGSPFKQISADYFNWNFLLFPSQSSVLGEAKGTITDPKTTMAAGKGFVVGIDLKGTNPANYIPDDMWRNQDFGTRVGGNSLVKNKYVFDRLAYDSKNNIYPAEAHNLTEFATVDPKASVHYTEERIYATDADSPDLITGFNYFANPYPSPLDLDDLLVNGTVATEWNNLVVNNTAGDILACAWVMNPSSYAYTKKDDNTGKWNIYAKATYHVMSQLGSTYSAGTYQDGAGYSNVLAPYQMFLVYAHESRNASKLKFPLSKRKIDVGSLFTRSAPASNVNLNDDFLFEVRDLGTKTYDRTAVVIRTPDEIFNNNYLNISKVLTSIKNGNSRAVPYITETRVGQAIEGNAGGSILYTDDGEGVTLESNFVPVATGVTSKLVPLYLAPSQIAQEITIKGMRLKTMSRVEKIELIDNRDNKVFNMTINDDEYKTSINPNDKQDRFTLKFTFASSGIGDEDIPSEVDKSLKAYYNSGTLTVSGFDNVDMGSIISVYDIQGRIVKQAKVDKLTMEIYEVFSPGAYIVKVLGNKSHVSKFLAR